MSDPSLPRPALGVGALIGDTVRVFFSRIVTFVVLSLLPTAITVGVQVLILGVGAVVSPGQPGLGAVSGVGLVVVSLTPYLALAVFGAAVAVAAHDTKTGGTGTILGYVRAGLAQVIPLALCNLIAAILIVVGTSLAMVPGLWVFAVFAVVAPAIAIERCGFGGLRRSMDLTREYRWPIMGGAILLFLAMSLFVVLMFGVLTPVTNAIAPILSVVVIVFISAFSFSALFIWIGLLYARLRIIKEGAPTENLEEVFG
jgi:hypothetical protein